MPEGTKTRVSVYMDTGNWAWLQRTAERQRRSFSQQVDAVVDQVRAAERREIDAMKAVGGAVE